ncbi:form3 [Trypoxylus dichotomus]
MTDIEVLDNEITIQVANNSKMVARKKGVVQGLYHGRKLTISALIVEGLKRNLLSVIQLLTKGANVAFSSSSARIIGTDYTVVCKILKGLFVLEVDLNNEMCYNVTEDMKLWHLRLGHINRYGLKLPVSSEKCEYCIEGKATRKPFRQTKKFSRQIGDLIHTDIAGPVTPITSERYKYYQTKRYSSTIHNSIYTTAKRSVGMYELYMDKVRTKFAETNWPKELWGETIQCSAYELNRSPTKANNGIVPAAIWYDNKIDIEKLKVFGSCWATKLPKQNKLDARAMSYIIIGYCDGGYRLWDKRKNEIIYARDVVFDEYKCKYEGNKEASIQDNVRIDVEEKENENEQSIVKEIEIQEENVTIKDADEEIEEGTKKSKRNVHPPKYLEEFDLYTAYCLLIQQEDPKTYKDAAQDKEWNQAIEKELMAHKRFQTWEETDLPKGRKAIETRWVFRTKQDGLQKARLVVRGYQKGHKDDVYAPAAKVTTIRMALTYALNNNWKIKQLDVPTAFLNGDLESSVYIKIPEGVTAGQGKVLKLKRVLYGLCEAPRCWNKCFGNFAIKHGLKRGSLVSWSSRKQTSVALSTAEAEYAASASCGAEHLYVLGLATDFERKQLKCIMKINNQSTINMLRN